MKRVCPPILRSLIPVERDFVLKLDGTDIYEHGLWLQRSSYQLGACTPSTSYTSIPGKDGEYDSSLTHDTYYDTRAFLGGRDITFTLFTVGDLLQINETKAWLGKLNGDRIQVDWTPYDGVMYGRLSLGAWSDTWEGTGLTIASVSCTVHCTDPYLYARMPITTGFKKVVSPFYGWTGYGVDLDEFKGNAPFAPTIYLENYTGEGITFSWDDDGALSSLHVSEEFTGANLYYFFDSKKIVGSGDGSLEVDLGDDWFMFYPDQKPSNYYFGFNPQDSVPEKMTFAYTPRWLI